MDRGSGDGAAAGALTEHRRHALYAGVYAVSSVLLLLSLLAVTSVYRLRAAAYGKAIICHVASLCACYALVIVRNLGLTSPQDTPWVFAQITSNMAALFWMNVMGMDIFLTFSSHPRLRQLGRVRRKFLWYSLYAWGCPAPLTAALLARFFRQNRYICESCSSVRFLLLLHNEPALVLSVKNVLLFAATSCNILKAMKSTEVLNSDDSQRHGSVSYSRGPLQSQLYAKLLWMTGAGESVCVLLLWLLQIFHAHEAIIVAVETLGAFSVFCTLCLRREVWRRLRAALTKVLTRVRPHCSPPSPPSEPPHSNPTEGHLGLPSEDILQSECVTVTHL